MKTRDALTKFACEAPQSIRIPNEGFEDWECYLIERAMEKTIEVYLLGIYEGIKKDAPDLHCLTFTISEFLHRPPYLHGFIHVGKMCEEFNSIEKLEKLVSDKVSRRARNEILYRRYEKEVADEPKL